MKLLDIICVGDATIDILLSLPKNDPHITYNEDKTIRLSLGDKIRIENRKVAVGGIASNVSVGLSHLGVIAGFAGELGNDPFATKITNTLSEQGVDTSLVVKGDGESTLSVGMHYEGDRVLFVQHVKRPHNIDFLSISSKWVYLAGISDVWQHAYEQTLAFIARSGATFAFTPGSAQLHSSDKTLFDVIKKADILLLNKEEAEHILSTQHLSCQDMKTIITHIMSLGPKIVSVTDGSNGSFAGSSNGMYETSLFPAKVVEKTGAGDAYTSGFLAALFYKKDIPTAMLWGAANAASVVTKVGAQEGLLTKEAIEATLVQHKNVEVKPL